MFHVDTAQSSLINFIFFRLSRVQNKNSDSKPFKLQPKTLSGATLQKYQLEGFYWLKCLHDANLSGILADEMGLGKTIQALGLVAHLFDKPLDLRPCLIVCPKSTLGNWEAETTRCCPTVNFLILMLLSNF